MVRNNKTRKRRPRRGRRVVGMRVPNDPPSINQRPWYPYVLRTKATLSSSSIAFKVSDLRAILAEEFAYPDTQNFELRLIWARAWANNTTGRTYSFNYHNCDVGNGGEGNPVVASFDDTGTPVRYPKSGYRWLRTMTQTPIITAANPDTIFSLRSDATGASEVTLDVRFLWRIPGSIVPVHYEQWIRPAITDDSFEAMEDGSDDEL